MMKSILLTIVKHSNISHSTTSLARRALLLLMFLVASVGSVFGENGQPLWEENPSNDFEISANVFMQAFGSVSEGIILRIYCEEEGNLYLYTDKNGGWLEYGDNGGYFSDAWKESENCYEISLDKTMISQLTSYGVHILYAWVTKVTYELPAQDEFYGNYLGNDPIPECYVIESVEETNVTISVTPTVSSAKYVRFYLEKDGTTQEISSSALTLGSGDGQTSEEWQKRGVYVYRESGLTKEDLTVTVSLEAGTFPEYQLVAYFSDEAPTLDGETITKEPTSLNEKQIYSFAYPVKTVDQYIEWNQSTYTFDMTALIQKYISNDFVYNHSTGYISWSVYDGPYETGSPITVNGYNWSGDASWRLVYSDGTMGNISDARTLFSASDAELSQYWDNYTKPTLKAPNNFSNYSNYVVICEVSDESKNNIKVRYIFHFNEDGKVPFPGKLVGEQDGMTQTVSRSAESVDVDLTNGAFRKLTGNNVVYARFYVIDANGDFVEPTNLTVVYDGDNVTTCAKSEQGYYIYQGGDGFDLSKISVKYANPQNYKSYQVVGVFATDMETAIFENGTMAREPDWDLQYIYSFTYGVEETKEFFKTVEWTRAGMIPEASVDDPDIDWNISWDELSVEHYVKWYVEDNNGNRQLLVSGGKATDGAWTITASAYMVAEDVAVLTGQSAFTSSLWNTWGCPTIYAPADVSYETVKEYKIICEIYSNSAGEDKPNAKYTFTLNKKFLGELKVDDDSHQGGETMVVGVDDTNITIPLSKAQQAYNDLGISGTLRYVRVWLTTLSGKPVDPTGKLTISGMEQYQTERNTNVTYGYYLTNSINLSNATLTLDAETYNQYQVHVAFSTDNLTDTHEPDYDYVYTFSFNYAMKIVHKVLLYDSTNRTSVPNLLENSSELSIDCGVNRETLAQKLYVRWYLTDENGNVINDSFGFDCYGYNSIEDSYGYYKLGNFTFWDYGNNTGNNPIITLPNVYDYKNVRIVCVATTKTDGYSVDPWNGDPKEIQVEYVYTLYTENDVKGDGNSQVPRFVHYQGEAYRYLIEEKGDIEGAKQRDYIRMSGKVPEENYTWNIFTNKEELTTENIRQGVHTWEYDMYVIPGGEPQKLILPFQNYTDESKQGQDLEPQAYVRWYNWNTDEKVENDGTFEFRSVGTLLTEDDRGLFYIYKEKKNLWHDYIGVTFKPEVNFSESIDIACDVSKYSDGIVEIDNKYYLLHEPTLSTRYIFHIHPASEMADRLEKAKQKMEEAEKTNNAKVLFDVMAELEEDKGKVIVSLGENMAGGFSLRFDQPDYANYIFKKGSNYVPAVASAAQWYAYYENNGTIAKKLIEEDRGNHANQGQDNDRIFVFNYDEFKDIGNGKQYHVVGYVGDGSGDITPVAHYELHFIEAPPILIDDLINKPDIHKERTYAYMNYYYDRAGLVDFDGNPETNPNVVGHEVEYYSTSNWYDAPTSPADNMSYVPFQWDDIQYGFCYPKLVPTIKNGWDTGAAPEHGDYVVVKSMNVTDISPNEPNFLPFGYRWHDGGVLQDYTYYLTNSTGVPQHGSFLYTDASDEARSIATIPFNASLCNGSSIYFTAFVADKTGEYIRPQLLIRVVGIKDDGTRERIMAFHTGILDDQVSVSPGKWYQIYSASTMPTGFDPSITRFEAEIINYASGASGADFAIDQIVIYTSNTKVLLTQTSKGDCNEEEESTVKVYMEAEGLQSAFNIDEKVPQPIYWRVCEEGTSKVVKGPGMYPRYSCTYNEETDEYTISKDPVDNDEKGENEYGVVYVYVKSNYSEDDEMQSGDLYGWYYDEEEGKYYFQIADKSFEWLERGKNYYVSVYSPQGDIKENNTADWGNPAEICSIYSEFFIPRRQYVTYIVPESDGEEGGEITIPCGSNGAEVRGIVMVLKVPDDTQISGFRDEKISFDYILCSKNEWGSDVNLGNDISYNDLVAALADYRETYRETVGLDDSYQHETYRETLEKAIAAKILILAASPEFTYTFSEAGTHYVTCIPISNKIDNTETEICGPFEVIFKLKSSGGPSLTLGFEGVDYTNKGIRVVRVGLGQIKNMQKANGYLLHIPVHSYKTDADAKEKEGTVLIDGNLEMLQYQEAAEQTNDKDWNENIDVATFANDKINKDNMYISVNFSGITNPAMPTFKEGFTYRMFFLVKNEGSEDGACEGKVEFLMKVVPEYVTWNDKGAEVTPNSNQNTNWNNDANWSRSKKEELHKTSGYQNNGTEVGDNGVTSTPATFVPMKFTYVTIPSDNVAPNLIELETGTTVGTDDGIYTNIGEGATPNIQYDMMVKVEDECSHEISGNVYDCETFYGNWAKEIYFKPRAELVNQQYLTYEKVWVEKELTANTWTLMSTPLQNTYAGDMYVPISGRQETEAFTDINFGEGYSRTLYPIYQKSWKQEGSKVYTMTNDVRATKYEAGLKGGVTSTLTQWSHTYNDVQEPYSQWKGFAIRAHKKEQNDKALLRLPKEDTNYNYYDWNGTVPEENNVMQTVGKPTTGKLFTDNENNIIGLTYGVKYGIQERTAGDGGVSVKIDEIQNNNYYLLVGNPYLSSIDMAEFLKANETILEDAYWTYEHNTIESPYTKGTIKPLQSFFVKVRDGVTNGDTNITFTPDMMVDGNTRSIAPSAVSSMALVASNNRGQSTATLLVGEETKSVETLFDSNLEEVPMVYTVANGQAVSIQQLTDLDKPVAFGVACAASDELVEVTFSDIVQLTEGDLFVLDAMTGEQTKVGEGDGYSVQPNDYGRYFLLAGTTNISDKVDVQNGIMVSVRGKEVTVTSGEELTLVHALSLTGATVYQDAARSTTASFSLPSGVYLIKVENVAGEQQTVKVIVK